jgi:hypothetical protein
VWCRRKKKKEEGKRQKGEGKREKGDVAAG